MAKPHSPAPAMLVVAAFSRHAQALDWARQHLEAEFGPVALGGMPYAFHHTTYYAAQMGTDLQKQLLAFRDLVKPDDLPRVKYFTNEKERQLAVSGTYAEPRPLNLDPGLLTLGKLLLATTKDQAHRIYLRDGIYAEVTLRFQAGAFEPWPWTYADYREPAVRAFLKDARDVYQQQLIQLRGRHEP